MFCMFLVLESGRQRFLERSSRAYLYCSLKSKGTWCSVVKAPGAWLVVLNIASFGSQIGLCGKDGQKFQRFLWSLGRLVSALPEPSDAASAPQSCRLS
jgi:hypothetical protein